MASSFVPAGFDLESFLALPQDVQQILNQNQANPNIQAAPIFDQQLPAMSSRNEQSQHPHWYHPYAQSSSTDEVHEEARQMSSSSHHSSTKSESHSPTASAPADKPPPKKKRRQNIACDSCRTRRVKCDLESKDIGQPCTKCVKQGINCTKKPPAPRAPVKRGGTNIELSKKLFGEATSSEEPPAAFQQQRKSSPGIEPAPPEPQIVQFNATNDVSLMDQTNMSYFPTMDSTTLPGNWDVATSFEASLFVNTNLPRFTAAPAGFTPPSSSSSGNSSTSATQSPDFFTLGPGAGASQSFFMPSATSAVEAVPNIQQLFGTKPLPVQQSMTHWFGAPPTPTNANTYSSTHNNASSSSNINGVMIATHPASQGLVTVTLKQELERNMINKFFQNLHHSLPAIDPQIFKAKFDAAGQSIESMGNTGEVLAKIMQSFGARYSDHPYILGGSPLTNPEAGAQREAACQTLLDTSLELVHSRRIMTEVSLESCQCLLLLIPLLAWRASLAMGDTDAYPTKKTKDQMMIRMFEGALSSQMDLLEVFDDVPVSSIEQSEVMNTLMNVKSQRVAWSAWISDAFAGMARGRKPTYAEDAIYKNFPFLPKMGSTFPAMDNLSALQAHVYTLGSWVYLGSVSHRTSRTIVQPLNSRKFQIEDIAERYKEAWTAMDESYDFFDRATLRAAPSLPNIPHFSPIVWTLSVKMAYAMTIASIHFPLHEVFVNEMKDLKNAPQGHVSEEDDSTSAPEVSQTVEVKNLYFQSCDYLLKYSRRMVGLIASIIDSDILRSAGEIIRELRTVGEILSEFRTVEQGYQGTDKTWTWEAKRREVGIVLQGLEQVSFSWGKCTFSMDKIKKNLERTAPTTISPADPPIPLKFVNSSMETDVMVLLKLIDKGQQNLLDEPMRRTVEVKKDVGFSELPADPYKMFQPSMLDQLAVNFFGGQRSDEFDFENIDFNMLQEMVDSSSSNNTVGQFSMTELNMQPEPIADDFPLSLHKEIRVHRASPQGQKQ